MGISTFAVCWIKSAVPYSPVTIIRVTYGIRRKLSTFEEKVPIANIKVLVASFLYLSKFFTS